ncbi:MAG: diphthine synthase [Nanoarchaeota archaeon]|nr:diphthine synthase [Nanoarchaeota archaeon]
MFHLIGLGLGARSFSIETKEIISKSDKIYIENYTVEFPYDLEGLEKKFGKAMILADRNIVESLKVLEDADKKDVVLLVYGSPLTATTHITLLQEAKKRSIDYKVIFNASIFDAVAETGLQLYKFGKIASMPGFEADSYIDVIKENLGINAHTLILVDIGMKFNEALEKLKKDSKRKGLSLGKIVICSRLGTKNSRILWYDVEKLKNEKIDTPFCFIILGKLHFVEEEFLNRINS